MNKNINTLLQEIELDLVDEGIIPITESTYFMTPAVKKAIKTTPKVTKKQMLEEAQPGDILVVYTPKKILDTIPKSIKAKIMSTFQGSPYSSSKLVIKNGEIAGYAVKSVRGGNNVVDIYTLRAYLKFLQEAMLIRVPNLTAEQIDKIDDYMRRREGMAYAPRQILQGFWNRITHRKLKPFFQKEMSAKQIAEVQEPLICSSIIAAAFKAAGFRKKFAKKIYDVWPRDFVIAPFVERVCRIDYR